MYSVGMWNIFMTIDLDNPVFVLAINQQVLSGILCEAGKYRSTNITLNVKNMSYEYLVSKANTFQMECNFTQIQAITPGFIIMRQYIIGQNGVLVSLITITCIEIIAL